MEEIKLSDGTLVRVNTVPWMLIFDTANLHPAFKVPDAPLDEIKTKGGHIETPPLLPGNPKYDEWKVEADRIEEERFKFQNHAMWDEGVKEWKLAGTKKWESQPPSDYVVPKMLDSVGAFSPYLDNRRIAYVRYEVCKTIQNVNTVMHALTEGMPLASTEVESAVEGFQGTPQGTAD